MPRKKTAPASELADRARLIEEIIAALQGMVELRAEPVVGEPGLVAVVGFVETDKIADVIRKFLEP